MSMTLDLDETRDRVRVELTIRTADGVRSYRVVLPGAGPDDVGDAIAEAVKTSTSRPWQVLAEALSALLNLDHSDSGNPDEARLCDALIQAAHDYSTWWHHHDDAGAFRNGTPKED